MNNIKYRLNLSIILIIALFTRLSAQEDGTNCDYACLKHPFAFRLGGTPGLSNFVSDSIGKYSGRFGYNLGGDFIWYFYNTEKMKANVSLGVSFSKFGGEYAYYSYQTYSTIDINKEDVIISEQVGSFTENRRYYSVGVPLKFEFNYLVMPRLNAYASAGISYGLMSIGNYENEGDLTRTGYYEKYNALIYDIDAQGSPWYYPTEKSTSGEGDIESFTTLTSMFGIGAKYQITPKISVFGGFKACFGMKNVFDNTSESRFYNLASNSYNPYIIENDNVKARSYGLELGMEMRLGDCNKKPKTKKVKEEKNKEDNAKVKEEKIEGVQITSKAVDSETGEPVEAKMVIKLKGKIIKTIKADKDGKFVADVPPGEVYDVEISGKGIDRQKEKIDLTKAEKGVKQEITANPIVKIAKGTTFKFNSVNFKTGTDNISEESLETLDLIADLLKENTQMVLEIGGHTDNTGGEEANRILSEKRAKSVETYLLSKGVEQKQIQSKGYGESKPIESNDTDAGRTKNRRVEFTVLEY